MELEKSVRTLFDACVRMNRHHPPELLRWFVADVLAGFGVDSGEAAPEQLAGWLREQSGEYARLVERHPFEDVLGTLYQLLGSHGHRAHLGQFFTPQPVADFMAALADPVDLPDESDPGLRGRLLRMCEPACGSGALVLGEVVVYSGNALAPWECLTVVVHASSRDLRPDVVLPALHPSRLEALRQATRAALPAAASSESGGRSAAAERKPDIRRLPQAPVPPTPPAASQVDLFAG